MARSSLEIMEESNKQLFFSFDLFNLLFKSRLRLPINENLPPREYPYLLSAEYVRTIADAVLIIREFIVDEIQPHIQNEFPLFSSSTKEMKNYLLQKFVKFTPVLEKSAKYCFHSLLLMAAVILEIFALCYERGLEGYLNHASMYWEVFFRLNFEKTFHENGGWNEFQLTAQWYISEEQIPPVRQSHETALSRHPERRSDESALARHPEEYSHEAALARHPEEHSHEDALARHPEEQSHEAALARHPEEQSHEAALARHPEEKSHEAALARNPGRESHKVVSPRHPGRQSLEAVSPRHPERQSHEASLTRHPGRQACEATLARHLEWHS